MTTPTDLSTLLASLDAAVEKMTPRPWSRSHYPSLLDPFAATVADFNGVVALVNAYPQLRAALRSLSEENRLLTDKVGSNLRGWQTQHERAKDGWRQVAALRALVEQQREALREAQRVVRALIEVRWQWSWPRPHVHTKWGATQEEARVAAEAATKEVSRE